MRFFWSKRKTCLKRAYFQSGDDVKNERDIKDKVSGLIVFDVEVK